MKNEITDGERKMFARGIVAGTITGFLFGLMVALFITLKAPGAVWLPSVFLPLALLVAWWASRELYVPASRQSPSLQRASFYRRRGS